MRTGPVIENFVIGKVFEKIDTKKIKAKANDFPTEPCGEYCVPLLTAGVKNQGLTRYAKRSDCPTILSNVISVSANGNSGTVYYQSEEIAVLQDAYAIRVTNYEIPNCEIGLYLATSLYKAVAFNYDWNFKAIWNRIRMDLFCLPIQTDENNNPIIDNKKIYHEEGFIPDWNFMERYIKEIETYLAITGLSNYKLTDG